MVSTVNTLKGAPDDSWCGTLDGFNFEPHILS